MKIGVFDSGVGGAAVAARLRELLPDATVMTAHDHANVPYGSRTAAEVYRLTRRAIQPLLGAGADVIVLACNTATAEAIDQLRSDYPDTPFVGLEPMVKPASRMTRSGTVLVCATPATLSSQRYHRLKGAWARGVRIVEPDCSGWAAAVERGEAETVDLSELVQLTVEGSADVVVLGCTHYHWLKPRVEAALGPDVTVLEPSDAVAAQIQRITTAASAEQHNPAGPA